MTARRFNNLDGLTRRLQTNVACGVLVSLLPTHFAAVSTTKAKTAHNRAIHHGWATKLTLICHRREPVQCHEYTHLDDGKTNRKRQQTCPQFLHTNNAMPVPEPHRVSEAERQLLRKGAADALHQLRSSPGLVALRFTTDSQSQRERPERGWQE